ncbi:MAG TPA: hypothetical protein VGN93_22350 [Shinella sp.]|jgi:hypothetical protein|uniref:hypothetical protein n=1 Tax=Shinella sp. TaxID=1870904 RepID=UPI002E1493F6|nr:hypothetical protein [Shinella sp.]
MRETRFDGGMHPSRGTPPRALRAASANQKLRPSTISNINCEILPVSIDRAACGAMFVFEVGERTALKRNGPGITMDLTAEHL